MINNIQIEICLGNIQDVSKLNKYPVDRIELNSGLEVGGLTPSISTLIEAKKKTDIKICSMCRCRGGSFSYTEEEYDTLFKDAKLLLENGTDGVVFGFLNSDNTVNIDKTKEMVELIHSYGKEAVFHKAFDETLDLFIAAKQLSDLGVDRILTSGGESDIVKGAPVINKLHKQFPELQFLPGGGVRTANIKEIISVADSGQIHMTSKKLNQGNYIELDETQLQEFIRILEDYD